MKRYRRLALIGVLVASIGAVATLPVSASTTTGPTTTTGPAAPGPKKVKIKVGDNYFKPKKVKVIVGDTVTFVWIGSAIHDVEVKKGPQKFESDAQASGKLSEVILEPGKYKIVCTLHPGMEMKMTAKPVPPVTSTSYPPPAP